MFFKNFFKRKITILTGAGFTTTNDFAGVTTRSLTNELRNFNHSDYLISGQNPGEYIYNLLTNYSFLGHSTSNPDFVNFERIIHFLEELYAYLKASDTGIDPKKREVTGAFSMFNDAVIKDFNLTAERATRFFSTAEYILTLYKEFIKIIINSLASFNDKEKILGMNEFCDLFLNKYLKDKFWIKRIYTLNYDTWLNKYYNKYFDGFNNTGEFLSDDVMKRRNINCHYNLHGCILWEPNITDLGIKKVTHIKNVLSQIISPYYGMDGKPIIKSPIITGFNKSLRMKYSPYLQFYYSLHRDIIESDVLLLIGYGFGDIHINSLLQLFKKKVIIVDFLKKFEKYNDTTIFMQDYPNYEESLSSNIRVFNWEIPIDYSKRGWVTNLKLSSNERSISYWYKGIGKEFYDNWGKIFYEK